MSIGNSHNELAERGLGLRMFHSIPKFIFVPASSCFMVLKKYTCVLFGRIMWKT